MARAPLPTHPGVASAGPAQGRATVRATTRRLGEIAGLVLVLTAMDQLYRWLHPEVNLVRACLVGATAWLTLRALALAGIRFVSPERGALAVFASAFTSVLLIQGGWLVSRSPTSVGVHVALVAVAWLVLARRPRATRGLKTPSAPW